VFLSQLTSLGQESVLTILAGWDVAATTSLASAVITTLWSAVWRD
jgi:hypothetical protein